MPKYLVHVGYYLEFEAETRDEAENLGWDTWIYAGLDSPQQPIESDVVEQVDEEENND